MDYVPQGGNMQEQFVTYDIALKLKTLGFNKNCFAYHYKPDNNAEVDIYDPPTVAKNWNGEATCISLPLWQQVEEWLRERHNIQLSIFPDYDGDGVETVWDCNIVNLCWGTYKEHHIEDYIRNSDKDRSKCLETAILRALELLTTYRK